MNEIIKETAKIVLKEVKEYWETDFRPPPIPQIRFNIKIHHQISDFIFDEAINYLINEEIIELDVN